MSDNFDENDNENFGSSIVKPKSSSSSSFNLNITFKELLQELYIILLNTEVKVYYSDYNIDDKLNEFINNFLFEYDLDPKNVLEIMTSSSQNISCYSSLIGFFYQHGIGCTVDKIKAFETFSKTIKNSQKAESNQVTFNQNNEVINDNIKLNEMGLQYFYSLFLYKDIILHKKNNYKLHIKNAEKGDPVSQYCIGNCYRYSKKDYNKAVEWYSKSSEGGNVKAMYMLGLCYYDGLGIKCDEKKAFELFLKSAKGEYESALYMVGTCYHCGNGILKDENKAFEWYLKAAKKGNSYSQNFVANYYNDGIRVPKNEEKVFYWNRKAAINGNYCDQYKLAKYYLHNSIKKNERKAFKWYLKLAYNNYTTEAKYLVAKCFRDGVGVDKDLYEARKWFRQYESLLGKNYSNYEEDSDNGPRQVKFRSHTRPGPSSNSYQSESGSSNRLLNSDQSEDGSVSYSKIFQAILCVTFLTVFLFT